jgi:hypothetical protein
VMGYCLRQLNGLMNFDVAKAPLMSSTRNVKNADIRELELRVSLDSWVSMEFSEYGTNSSFFEYS